MTLWKDLLKTHGLFRYEEGEILEWYEGFLQDCPNGRLYEKVFIEMYKEFFPAADPVEFAKSIFRYVRTFLGHRVITYVIKAFF